MRSPRMPGNPDTQRSEAKVVHSFGRADQLDKAALGRLVHSIRRVLVDDGIQEVMAKGEAVKVADIEIERVQELGRHPCRQGLVG